MIVFFISIPLALLGYIYVHLFLPDFYQVAKFYLLILALALAPTALKNVMRAALESYFKTKEILFVSIVPNVLRLAFFVIGGLLYGIIGIIWAIVLSAWIEYGFYYNAITQSNKQKKIYE